MNAEVRERKLKPRVCEFCGKEFIPKQERSRFCSPNCYHRNYAKTHPELMRKNAATYRKNHPDRKTRKRPERKERCYAKTCINCGREFTSAHHWTAYCSDECRREKQRVNRNRRWREMYARNPEHFLSKRRKCVPKVKAGVPTVCPCCGREFIPRRVDNVFCSRKCYILTFKKINREYYNELNKGWRRRHRPEHLVGYPKQGTCEFCGKDYLKRFPDHRCCSDECRAKLYAKENIDGIRNMRRYRYIERCEIFERDPEAYAGYRRKRRILQAESYSKRHVRKFHYIPHNGNRIPDWAVKGEELLDRNSTFLRLSRENEAYGMELAIEGGKKMGREFGRKK